MGRTTGGACGTSQQHRNALLRALGGWRDQTLTREKVFYICCTSAYVDHRIGEQGIRERRGGGLVCTGVFVQDIDVVGSGQMRVRRLNELIKRRLWPDGCRVRASLVISSETDIHLETGPTLASTCRVEQRNGSSLTVRRHTAGQLTTPFHSTTAPFLLEETPPRLLGETSATVAMTQAAEP